MIIFHRLNDDQFKVLDAIKKGKFKYAKGRENQQGHVYRTFDGLEFSWIEETGEVKIISEKQPEWFARRVRRILSK